MEIATGPLSLLELTPWCWNLSTWGCCDPVDLGLCLCTVFCSNGAKFVNAALSLVPVSGAGNSRNLSGPTALPVSPTVLWGQTPIFLDCCSQKSVQDANVTVQEAMAMAWRMHWRPPKSFRELTAEGWTGCSILQKTVGTLNWSAPTEGSWSQGSVNKLGTVDKLDTVSG